MEQYHFLFKSVLSFLLQALNIRQIGGFHRQKIYGCLHGPLSILVPILEIVEASWTRTERTPLSLDYHLNLHPPEAYPVSYSMSFLFKTDSILSSSSMDVFQQLCYTLSTPLAGCPSSSDTHLLSDLDQDFQDGTFADETNRRCAI